MPDLFGMNAALGRRAHKESRAMGLVQAAGAIIGVSGVASAGALKGPSVRGRHLVARAF
jgi:hypothetical protein